MDEIHFMIFGVWKIKNFSVVEVGNNIIKHKN